MPVGAQQLNGDFLLNLAVRALRQVDASHSATSEKRNHAVGADDVTGRSLAVNL